MFEKLEKMQLIWLAVILALGLVVATKIAIDGLSKNGISVTGSSYQLVQSDSGRIEFEIVTRKPDRASAYKLIQSQLPIVISYLGDNGFLTDDIEVKTNRGYYTYKYTPSGMSTNEVAYYNLSQPIVVKSNDVQKIKDISVNIQSLIDKSIEINVNQPEYFYSKLSDLKVKLLQDATTDAKQRASTMLKAAGNKPGKIESVRMGIFQITPPDSNDVSDMGINDTSTIEKKVTAVANVIFKIK